MALQATHTHTGQNFAAISTDLNFFSHDTVKTGSIIKLLSHIEINIYVIPQGKHYSDIFCNIARS